MSTMLEFSEIRNKLRNTLSEQRYEHTLGVAYTASAMAMRYGSSMEQAMLAGLLHDCAKYLSKEESIALLNENGQKPTEIEKINPVLLHARCGTIVARQESGI